MRVLLDTHTALWWVNEFEKLSPQAKALLMNDSYSLHLSIVSIWEIAIKSSLNKLPELRGGAKAFLAKVEEMPIELIAVEPRHVVAVEDLPFIHRDPFDRLLVGTAKADSMTILTADENIHKYDVQTVW